ncbi:hypothetical protein PanWU01x14_200700, partial [Parasponia andersonii]
SSPLVLRCSLGLRVPLGLMARLRVLKFTSGFVAHPWVLESYGAPSSLKVPVTTRNPKL